MPLFGIHRRAVTAGLSAAAIALLGAATGARAADHGDAPQSASDRSTDIADVYAFMDPNPDPDGLKRLIVLFTTGGFIVPGEAANFGFFDSNLRYRIDLETNGDSSPDLNVDVTFAKRSSAANAPQTATIELPFGRTFTAPTTPPTIIGNPAAQVVTTDSLTKAKFFAGTTDDPFFFDIPAFGQFVASVLGGAPNAGVFNRRRDSFAGYNVITIGFSIPLRHLRLANPDATKIGVSGGVMRRAFTTTTSSGVSTSGSWVQVERMGNPAINVALIPFPRKDEHNRATQVQDAQGKFKTDIVATLSALGTNTANINLLASIAINKGDYLRVDTAIANSGPGGGNNAGAGFPNGRRPQDDVIDTILAVVSNGGLTTGDGVNGNDRTFGDVFPFLAPPQTARPNTGDDDGTMN